MVSSQNVSLFYIAIFINLELLPESTANLSLKGFEGGAVAIACILLLAWSFISSILIAL